VKYVLINQHFGMLRRCVGPFDSRDEAWEWVESHSEDPSAWSVMEMEEVGGKGS